MKYTPKIYIPKNDLDILNQYSKFNKYPIQGIGTISIHLSWTETSVLYNWCRILLLITWSVMRRFVDTFKTIQKLFSVKGN